MKTQASEQFPQFLVHVVLTLIVFILFCLRWKWSDSPFVLVYNMNGECHHEEDSTKFQFLRKGGDCETAFGRGSAGFRPLRRVPVAADANLLLAEAALR